MEQLNFASVGYMKAGSFTHLCIVKFFAVFEQLTLKLRSIVRVAFFVEYSKYSRL
jgi:hypothetical protein